MIEQKFQIEIGGKKLIIETRKLAEQASGSCLVRYGDTTVLVTAVMSKYKREGIDFLPLSVEYEERYYAAGKILGSRYLRRESRPSDEAILTARLIDRIIRPCFSKNIRQDIQIVVTCLSWDGENDPDILGLLGASLALSISDIPWSGPVALLRATSAHSLQAGQKEGKFILNPNYQEREESDFDLVLGGKETQNKEFLINMIEAEAKEIKEETILEAAHFLSPYLKKLIDFQNQIVKKIGKEKRVLESPFSDSKLEKEVKEFLKGKLEKALYSSGKREDRAQKENELKEELIKVFEEKYPEQEKMKYVQEILEQETEKLFCEKILETEERPDKRKLDQIREIHCEVGILPRTHGSGLFFRGETKSLSILTLGSPGEHRLLEGMEFIGKKRFMHHYNFPPYSVGETRPMRGPGRREIGHGILVEKALKGILPDSGKFPYTIRIVSEILSSNGSSSMASACGSSLALLDAGVPIKRAVAGIAIGLVSSEDLKKYKILTDIQGPEDHYGDMDFKVTGTKNGITAIQMDVKIKGINEKILKEALEQAKKARIQILEKIEKVLPQPREKLSQWAPKIYTLKINPEKIREVIGPKGKVINEIIDKCGVSVDIEEDGTIFITAIEETAAEKAIEWIKNITREVKVGEIFQGKVKKIMDFGAFIEILPGQEGLAHISELAPYRVEKVEDIIKKEGDIVTVKVIGIDDQGKISLSVKRAKK